MRIKRLTQRQKFIAGHLYLPMKQARKTLKTPYFGGEIQASMNIPQQQLDKNKYVIREGSNTSSGGKPCRPMTSTHFAEQSRGSTQLKTVKRLLIIQLAACSTLYKQVRREICWTTKSNAGRQMCKFRERRGPCRPVTSFLLRQRSQATFLLFFQLSYIDEFP